MTPTDPTVAVVIPCHNHGEFLPEALASVRAQRRPADQIVVVDDGSTEAPTRRVLDKLAETDVKLIRQSNQGLAAARNAGIRATQSDFFIPLDADDRLAPRFIERLLPPILNDPQLGWAYAHTRFFGARHGLWRCAEFDPLQLLLHNLSPATALIRRAAYDAAGGYRSVLHAGYEDWDLWIAIFDHGYTGHCIGEPLFEYRQHPDGSMLHRMGHHRRQMRRAMIRAHFHLFAVLLYQWPPAARDVLFARRQPPPEAPTALQIDQLLNELGAALQLDYYTHARSWRLLTALLGDPLANRPLQPPTATLATLKASRRFRTWSKLKHSRFATLFRRLFRRPPPPHLPNW